MYFPSNEMQKELAPGFESCVHDRCVVMSGSLVRSSWFFISHKKHEGKNQRDIAV